MRTNMCMLALAATLSVGAGLTGCTKDLYDPTAGKQELPDPGSLPNFNTRSSVSLSVDYQEPGFKTLVEVFTEYPYELDPDGNVVRKEIEPVFAGYTDDQTRLAAQFDLATNVKLIYLHCSAMGMPRCVPLEVVDGRITFKTSDLNADSDAKTRAIIGSPTAGGSAPWMLNATGKLSSLCQWNSYGKPTAPANYLDNITGTQQMLTDIQHLLWNGAAKKPGNLDNTKYTKESKYTNISIAKFVKNEQGEVVPVESAVIKLNFLQEAAWDQNSIGYYYYPTDKVPAKAADVEMKYLAFPNLSTGDTPPYGQPGGGGLYFKKELAPMSKNQQITLLYTNEKGEVSESFPPGYTIGWFIIPNGFAYGSTVGTVDTGKGYLYSNETWNVGNRKRCIALNYKNEKVVLGFEDASDLSYEDLLFYAESNPKGAIINPDQPIVTPDNKPATPDQSVAKIGTYLFEDQWPKGGDYDMNDVMVEYKRVVWFNADNMVTKIEDIFVPKEKAENATFANAFAYQVDPGQVGTYTLSKGITFEKGTNSFIVFTDGRMATGEYKIVREFKTGSFHKDQLKEYNPYIIVKYVPENKLRVEVHLPKGNPTNFADQTLVGTIDDAYFIHKNGKYPFAIDLPIHGFSPVTERSSIGDKEYPRFAGWAESGCTKDTEWYLHK